MADIPTIDDTSASPPTDWTNLNSIASTASSLGGAIQSIGSGIAGFKASLSDPAGGTPTIQPTPSVAGPVASDATSTVPTWYQKLAAKFGAPVWGVFTGIGVVVLILIGGVWMFIRRKR